MSDPPIPRIHRPRRGPWLQLWTPRGFEWNVVALPIASLPSRLERLKLIHLTDLHLRPDWTDAYDELMDRIRAANADLVFLTGDIIEHRTNPQPSLPTVERFIRSLQSRLGVFSILGNHDGDLIGPYVEQFGSRLMNRRYLKVDVDGNWLELVGIPGVNRRDLRRGFLESIPARSPAVPRIVLSHYPDAIHKIASLNADVVLSGHTHGGQVCVPGGIPIIKHTSLPRSMCTGLFHVNNTWLLTSRGFGFAKLRFRVFCPAEVIEVTLCNAREPNV